MLKELDMAQPTGSEGTSGHTLSLTGVHEIESRRQRFAIEKALNVGNLIDIQRFSKHQPVEELQLRQLPCPGPKKQLIRRLLGDNARGKAQGPPETVTSVRETRNAHPSRIEDLSEAKGKLQADVERLRAETEHLVQDVPSKMSQLRLRLRRLRRGPVYA